VLAYSFPLLSLVFAMFWFAMLFAIFFGVVWAFVDNFRRRDHSGWAKAGWALVILAIPLIGMLIYIGTRPGEGLDAV
jgi:hypothetical protein